MDLASEIAACLQIIFIDIVMSGDNAIIVGMAAAGLPKTERHRAVIAGIAAATVLRILFAFFAVQLLQVTGLLAAGGFLLLWVAWKMFMEIRHLARMRRAGKENEAPALSKAPAKKLSDAILQIVVADVSMSLDNVLAVAGVAREHLEVMIAGLALSVLLMGAASALVARLTGRFPWIAILGLIVVLYTALRMIWDGGHQLAGTL